MRFIVTLVITVLAFALSAQNLQNNPASNHGNKFEQLGTILPDANTYRTGSGAPGHEYWQQRADYKITARLDEKDLRLHGDEEVTYFNNSPDALTYLWLQLDDNEHKASGENINFNDSPLDLPLTDFQLERLDFRKNLKDFGVNIETVTDKAGNKLPYTINYTMMRIDLPKPLLKGQKVVFRGKWNYKIVPRLKVGGRGGYELFEGDGNSVFTMAQWFPRMCVYSDYQGWNNKQFTGRGEFSLVFGNYDVTMQVPADHVICATGTLQNAASVLDAAQLARWKQAQNASTPVEVVTLDEAKAREKNPEASRTKTWRYTAENVRDFAWGSSRKFVWDAMAQDIEGKKVMCMSYYPKEAYGLYNRYSTKVVAHTLRVYSKHTVAYPYPTAISVEASNGMEYPMICFNFGRTEADGTYSSRTKYGMIGVIIHEVGHNFFPMIINSDERQWSWMDEGLNTFVQFLTEQEFDNEYPSSRGPAHKIVDYMRMPANQLEPIMTNSENIAQFGNNAYAKPATALNILRETVMGRELFDYAFKEYARRWAFKHPAPADFFRTMEDASGVDLDWFWRGWFYDIQPVDIALDSVRAFTYGAGGELAETPASSSGFGGVGDSDDADFQPLSKIRNKQSGMQFLIDQDTLLRDFYYYYKPENKPAPTTAGAPTTPAPAPPKPDKISEEDAKKYQGRFYYELTLANKGGLVMPVIVQWNYADGTSDVEYISAYLWRKNEGKVVKSFVKEKEVASIVIDPFRETADIDTGNQTWPKGNIQMNRFELYKSRFSGRRGGGSQAGNPMQRAAKKG